MDWHCLIKNGERAIFINKTIGKKVRDGVISALKWAGPLSLTGGYFTYFTVFRFLEQNFTSVKFGIFNLLMRSVFDLTILTFCVGMWLPLTMGFAFGENKNLQESLRSVVISFKKLFPYNFFYWFSVNSLCWYIFPEASSMKWLHSLAYIVWIGYFSKKVSDFIIEEESAPPSRNGFSKNGKVSSSAIADELVSLEERISLGWDDIARVVSQAAQAELNEIMPSLMRLRFLIQVKFVKGGGNIGEMLSEIDASLNKIAGKKYFHKYYGRIRTVISSLPHQGMNIFTIVNEAERLDYLVGGETESIAHDIRHEAHTWLDKAVYEQVKAYKEFLVRGKEIPFIVPKPNDQEAARLVRKYLQDKLEGKGKDIYSCILSLENSLELLYGERGYENMLHVLALWEHEAAAVQNELCRHIVSLRKMIEKRNHLWAIEVITRMRNNIYGLIKAMPQHRLKLIYMDLALENILGQLSGHCCEEVFAVKKANFSAILTLSKLLIENIIYSGWAGRHILMLSKIVDASDRRYSELKNIVEQLMKSLTDILDEMNETADIEADVARRLMINDEQREKLKANYRRSIVNYDKALQVIERVYHLTNAVLENEGDGYIFGAPKLFSHLPDFVHIDSADSRFVLDNEHRLQEDFGGKDGHLLVMNSMGLPVPSGFEIPISVSRYKLHRRYPKDFEKMVRENMRLLEENWAQRQMKVTGKRRIFKFNPTVDEIKQGIVPLLVSVRSGSILKMPGILLTVLNVGSTEEAAEALLQMFHKRFTYDTHSRFLESYGEYVYSIDTTIFNNVISECESEMGVKERSMMSAEQLYELNARFKKAIVGELEKMGEDPVEFKKDLQDPYRQLTKAIVAVLESWDREDARQYRAMHGISDGFYTPVTVQAMVYGNFSENSGAGAVLTEDWEGNITGEYSSTAQGRDIADGLIIPYDIHLLKERAPELYRQLSKAGRRIRLAYGNNQELEFTIENGRLWFLQTSRTAVVKAQVWKELAAQGYSVIAKGRGVYGGGYRGRVVFALEQIEEIGTKAKIEGFDGAILVMHYPVPADAGRITGKGLGAMITEKGGISSHGASIARGDKIHTIVGVDGLTFDTTARVWMLGGGLLKEGDILSLDYREEKGLVYRGEVSYTQDASSPVEEGGEWQIISSQELGGIQRKLTMIRQKEARGIPDNSKIIIRKFRLVAAIRGDFLSNKEKYIFSLKLVSLSERIGGGSQFKEVYELFDQEGKILPFVIKLPSEFTIIGWQEYVKVLLEIKKYMGGIYPDFNILTGEDAVFMNKSYPFLVMPKIYHRVCILPDTYKLSDGTRINLKDKKKELIMTLVKKGIVYFDLSHDQEYGFCGLHIYFPVAITGTNKKTKAAIRRYTGKKHGKRVFVITVYTAGSKKEKLGHCLCRNVKGKLMSLSAKRYVNLTLVH